MKCLDILPVILLQCALLGLKARNIMFSLVCGSHYEFTGIGFAYTLATVNRRIVKSQSDLGWKRS